MPIRGKSGHDPQKVRGVLAASPKNFEALSVYAYIEAQLQDYPVAGETISTSALRAPPATLPQ